LATDSWSSTRATPSTLPRRSTTFSLTSCDGAAPVTVTRSSSTRTPSSSTSSPMSPTSLARAAALLRSAASFASSGEAAAADVADAAGASAVRWSFFPALFKKSNRPIKGLLSQDVRPDAVHRPVANLGSVP